MRQRCSNKWFQNNRKRCEHGVQKVANIQNNIYIYIYIYIYMVTKFRIRHWDPHSNVLSVSTVKGRHPTPTIKSRRIAISTHQSCLLNSSSAPKQQLKNKEACLVSQPTESQKRWGCLSLTLYIYVHIYTYFQNIIDNCI